MDEPLTPQEERDALAAELALEILTGEERAAALRLQLSDPAFAGLVRGWEARLAPLHGEWRDVAPHDAVWAAVAARIDGLDDHQAGLGDAKIRRWRMAAIASGAVAAALALMLVMRPAGVPVGTPPVAGPAQTAPTQMAMAQMTGAPDGPVVTARYDPRSAQLRLRVEGMKGGALAPELWIIPEGGKPVSLGLIARSGDADMTLREGQRAMMVDGATMAVTMEPGTGAPHAAPSSAPVAAGKISFI